VCFFTRVGEVSLSEFEFLDSETLFEDGFSDFTSDGNTASNLFESLDTEGSDGESGLREDGLLLGQIFQDLGSLGELITGFTDGDVQDELVNTDFSHGVIGLGLSLGLGSLGGSSLAHFATFKINIKLTFTKWICELSIHFMHHKRFTVII